MEAELKQLLEENCLQINNEIRRIFPEILDESWCNTYLGSTDWEYDHDAFTGAISFPVWELLKRGGKRWRPLLMKLAYESVGGTGDITRYTVIPELIHNGTLIIDDIEDNSDMRRGGPCVHHVVGNDIAINAGNTIYFLPLLLLVKDSSLTAEIKQASYELINNEMMKLGFGQGMDIYWHRGRKKDITEKQYLAMCNFKTGCLARMAAKLGAILGNASEKQQNSLGTFAESIGVAFQIQDDILNITNQNWGKDFGEDISEGKRSLPVIETLKRADNGDSERLIEILNEQTKDMDKILEAIGIIKKYNSIDYAKNRAAEIISNAWDKLDLCLPDSDAKNKMRLFADYLIQREI